MTCRKRLQGFPWEIFQGTVDLAEGVRIRKGADENYIVSLQLASCREGRTDLECRRRAILFFVFFAIFCAKPKGKQKIKKSNADQVCRMKKELTNSGIEEDFQRS